MGKGKNDGINVFKRYVWLLNTIYNAGSHGITQREIFEKWERKLNVMREGEPYNPKTFHNHRRKIEEIFDVNIICEGRRYYVEADYSNGMEFSEMVSWMVNAISIKNTVVDNLKLRDRILFEPIPAGGSYLQPILDAIEASAEVEIEYKRYNAERPERYVVRPYLIRLFRRRWYLVGECLEMGRIYTFSFDRIQCVALTGNDFEMPEIDDIHIFDDCAGIVWDDKKRPQTVRIRVYGDQIKYIDSLPLHSSQDPGEIKNDGKRDYCDFTYDVKITYDFIQELLSHGKHLEVLGPPELKKEMREHALEMTKYYSKIP